MRRKAKELQQARRDAERSGKKLPAFGGFGSGGVTSISSGSIITDTIVEPEKPKITPAPVRCSRKHIAYSTKSLFAVRLYNDAQQLLVTHGFELLLKLKLKKTIVLKWVFFS